MEEEIKEPKDLKVKVGTKEEAEWTKIKAMQEQNIRTGEINLKIARTVLELAEIKIKEEQDKFKK